MCLATPFYLLLKLFHYTDTNSIELLVIHNLLPKFIVAYEACEGEKRSRVSSTVITNKGDPQLEGEPQLLCIPDDDLTKLKLLKPKRSNSRPILNRYRMICNQFSRQIRRIELAQRNKRAVRMFPQNFWKSKQQQREREKTKQQIRALPGLFLLLITTAFSAGLKWILRSQERTILTCDLELLKAVHQPRAFLSIFLLEP
jgi:hypothetical protein